MKDYDRILRSIDKEMRQLSIGSHQTNAAELRKHFIQHLGPYVASKEALTEAVDTGVYLWEYAFFLRIRDEERLLQAFDEMFRIFHLATRLRPVEFAAAMRHYFAPQRRAIRDYADAFHLERRKHDQPDRLSVKIAFQEVAALLESCLLPYSRHLLCTMALGDGPDAPRLTVLDQKSFGSVVSAIAKNDRFRPIYVPDPWGLPLSQWRNIAYHHQYDYDEHTGTIACRHGASSREHVLTIPYRDLHCLCACANTMYCLHKVAFSLMSLDNHDAIAGLLRACGASSHSVVAAILEVFSANALSVIGLDCDTKPWRIFATDPLQRDERGLHPIMDEVGRLLRTMPGTELFVEVVEQQSGKVRAVRIGEEQCQ